MISIEMATKYFDLNMGNYRDADDQHQKETQSLQYWLQQCTSTSKKYLGYAAKCM